MATRSKYGEEVSEIGCKRVQVGTVRLPDGTVQPITEPQPYVPEAYRRLIEIVSDEDVKWHARKSR